MRFLHLSDLHLGKRVCEFSMLDDQRYILEQILSLLDSRPVDAVLLAGDLYDKPVPPAEAVRLLDWFLTELSHRELPVFAISGNHDSADRVAFGSALLAESRVYVSPVFSGPPEPITLTDAHGPVDLYLLPFLKPAMVRHVWPDAPIESYNDALACVLDHCSPDPARRSVLVAHQFVAGAASCESEEPSVGGIDWVDAALFDKFDYVALGHLHSPQKVGRDTLRYCGTPLKYSFSEASQHKSVTFVELGEKGCVAIAAEPLVPRHDLRELRGSYMELTDRRNYEGTAVDDYQHLILPACCHPLPPLHTLEPHHIRPTHQIIFLRQGVGAAGRAAQPRVEHAPPVFAVAGVAAQVDAQGLIPPSGQDAGGIAGGIEVHFHQLYRNGGKDPPPCQHGPLRLCFAPERARLFRPAPYPPGLLPSAATTPHT